MQKGDLGTAGNLSQDYPAHAQSLYQLSYLGSYEIRSRLRFISASYDLASYSYVYLHREEDDGVYSATVFWSENAGFYIDFWGQGNKMEEIPNGVGRAYYKQEIETTG